MLTQSCRTHLIDERPQTHSFRDLGRDRESLRGVETSCSGFLTLLQLLLLLPLLLLLADPFDGRFISVVVVVVLFLFSAAPSVVAPRRISCAIAFCGRPFVSIDASLSLSSPDHIMFPFSLWNLELNLYIFLFSCLKYAL